MKPLYFVPCSDMPGFQQNNIDAALPETASATNISALPELTTAERERISRAGWTKEDAEEAKLSHLP
jgi:hypothetical protein